MKTLHEKTYMLKEAIEVDLANRNKIAEIVGIQPTTLSKILNRKQACKKATASMITAINDQIYKQIDITKYFDEIEK